MAYRWVSVFKEPRSAYKLGSCNTDAGNSVIRIDANTYYRNRVSRWGLDSADLKRTKCPTSTKSKLNAQEDLRASSEIWGLDGSAEDGYGVVGHGIASTGKLSLPLKNKNQLDATCYFIVLLIGSTCFGHYYAHHQELTTMMLIITLVVSFLVCCIILLYFL